MQAKAEGCLPKHEKKQLKKHTFFLQGGRGKIKIYKSKRGRRHDDILTGADEGAGVIAVILLAGAIGIATVGVSIAGAICAYKTYYGLFRSCKPKPAVLFLALSILTPARPFLPHACHEADEGLPENAAQ